MTREEIERLEGRELDAMVEEAVFRRNVYRTQIGDKTLFGSSEGDGGLILRVPDYSREVEWAWDVVKEMSRRGYGFEAELAVAGGYPDEPSCSLAFGKTQADLAWNRYADTDFARAICRAALIALANEEAERNADA